MSYLYTVFKIVMLNLVIKGHYKSKVRRSGVSSFPGSAINNGPHFI